MDKAELRHELILEHLVRELSDRYGHNIMERHKYYRDVNDALIGELDLVVYTPKSVRVYEIKGSKRGFRHGKCQLEKARENEALWNRQPQKNTHYVCVTYKKNGEFSLERV